MVSESQLRRNARHFRSAFEAEWKEGPVRILPSLKANLSLALRSLLNQEQTGCDTFGSTELSAALQTGVNPAWISVNGATKDDALLETAVRAGARITLDSADEARRARVVARALGKRAQVRFRLRPRYEGMDRPSDFYAETVTIGRAAQQYKPGIPITELLPLGADVLTWPELDVSGVMVHLGRHTTDLEMWARMVESTVALLGELHRHWGGWLPREIDLGGGFASPRDPTGRLTPRGRERAAETRAPSIEAYAAVMAGTLKRALPGVGIEPKGIALEVEPGRALYADAGIHVCRVRHVKEQLEPLAWRWVETDTTEMFLLDSLVENARWTPVVCERADAPPAFEADVVGVSCGFDAIVAQARLPTTNPGDTIALLDTGAYQDACANNFNGLPRPGTVLVSADRAEWIKLPESYEEVFRRDRIPERFRGGAR
ncbi:MAG TPA: hypothetical protein VJS68_04120 [Thermoplasmata archaeon]|nr:hypothetical protein [Thermoplasmata archaeon]